VSRPSSGTPARRVIGNQALGMNVSG
jgi:hypothetical protein